MTKILILPFLLLGLLVSSSVQAAGIADGWISFYWGKSAKEYAADDANFVSALKGAWLERFKEIGPK